jgi:hypothetical protein
MALTSGVILAGTLALAVFIAAYAILAPWHKNPAGRALMVMSSGFFLVLLALTLRHPFNLSTANSPFFTWFQAAAIAVSVAGIAWITSVLLRAQWRGRHTRRYFETDRPDRHGKEGST